MNERLTPARAARLLRAKAAELEMFATMADPDYDAKDAAADIALVAYLLAEHIERTGDTETGVA